MINRFSAWESIPLIFKLFSVKAKSRQKIWEWQILEILNLEFQIWNSFNTLNYFTFAYFATSSNILLNLRSFRVFFLNWKYFENWTVHAVYTFFMYAGIHVCICTCYRDEPWRCLVDVNNGEVFVIYFDFEKGVFWSVNDLSSLFCVDLYFKSFWDVLAGCWLRAKILTSLNSRVSNSGTRVCRCHNRYIGFFFEILKNS